VVVVQADPFNASELRTVLVAVFTSNTRLAAMPGNVFVPASASGLEKDSVINVTALVCLDRLDLGVPVGQLPAELVAQLNSGLRRVLGLGA
jgi:mRNA interferase MazF